MIYPMSALVLLTFYVALKMFKARMSAVKAKQVALNYFKTYDTPAHDLPEAMVLTQRCYNNLLEMPILFYAGCLAVMAAGLSSTLMLVLAWLYVGCRITQAALHLRACVLWRMRFFMASCLCLLAIWGVLIGSLLAR